MSGMRDVLRLLECAPLKDIASVLDIGMGKGQVRLLVREPGQTGYRHRDRNGFLCC